MARKVLVVIDVFLATQIRCSVIGIDRKNRFVAEASPVLFAERCIHSLDSDSVLIAVGNCSGGHATTTFVALNRARQSRSYSFRLSHSRPFHERNITHRFGVDTFATTSRAAIENFAGAKSGHRLVSFHTRRYCDVVEDESSVIGHSDPCST